MFYSMCLEGLIVGECSGSTAAAWAGMIWGVGGSGRASCCGGSSC